MTVYFVLPESNLCHGRFIGPSRLLKEVGRLLPEAKGALPFGEEWREWIDPLEASGCITPALRWRVPGHVLAQAWAEFDEVKPIGTASGTDAAKLLEALRTGQYANAVWERSDWATQDLHPLDDPRNGLDAFIEDPSATPWCPGTYDPVSVGRAGIEHPVQDDRACIPLFRMWQALLLVERALAAPRRLFDVPLAALQERSPGRDMASWAPRTDVGGFAKHRDALEALSWFDAYRNHALQLTTGDASGLGMFRGIGRGTGPTGLSVLHGDAHLALLTTEKEVAAQALRRHAIDEVTLLDAASWLGRMARTRLRDAHAAAGRACADMMRTAVELMTSLGYELSVITPMMQDGASLINELFPVWLVGVRTGLERHLAFSERVADSHQDPSIPAPGTAVVGEFVAWLEERGLFAAHLSIQALQALGLRDDTDARVGVAMHVANLAAWVEHVCNDVLGTRLAGNGGLAGKLQQCWAAHPSRDALNSAFGRLGLPSTTSFDDAVRVVSGRVVRDRAGWLARDARLTCLVRNRAVHSGLAELQRLELHDATLILLRTALNAWSLGRQSTDG